MGSIASVLHEIPEEVYEDPAAEEDRENDRQEQGNGSQNNSSHGHASAAGVEPQDSQNDGDHGEDAAAPPGSGTAEGEDAHDQGRGGWVDTELQVGEAVRWERRQVVDFPS